MRCPAFKPLITDMKTHDIDKEHYFLIIMVLDLTLFYLLSQLVMKFLLQFIHITGDVF